MEEAFEGTFEFGHALTQFGQLAPAGAALSGVGRWFGTRGAALRMPFGGGRRRRRDDDVDGTSHRGRVGMTASGGGFANLGTRVAIVLP